MKKIITAALIVLCIVGISCNNLTFYNMKNITDFLNDQVNKHQTPSVQYAFFDTDSIIYSQYAGHKNVGSGEEVDNTTTYNLFSVTKTFTALAVLQLAQAGKIELERPVIFYLSAFPYDSTITIHQLLSHTSGIPNPIPLKWIHLAEEHKEFHRDLFFSEVFRAHPTLEFKPGEGFKYSNLGYVILGQVIEIVSGQSFEDYVTENIIERCGVDAAGLGFKADTAMHAIGYHKWLTLSNAIFGFLIDKEKYMAKREGRWKPFNSFYINGTAYGGMTGSSAGLIRYAQTLLKSDSILLNDAFKKILLTECVVKGKPTGMSLSWFTGALKGNRYFAHAGGGGGYYVELRIYPELGIGSVIMYNRSGMKDERILDRADGFFITEKMSSGS